MIDYEEEYRVLFNSISEAINILQRAQMESVGKVFFAQSLQPPAIQTSAKDAAAEVEADITEESPAPKERPDEEVEVEILPDTVQSHD